MIGFAIAAVVEVGEIYLWIRFLKRYRVQGGVEGMVGERVVVVEPCAPDGLVQVHGELWRALADPGDPLEPGERGTVLSVDGLKVTIARER